MNKIVKIFSVALVGVALATGCIKEIDPQTSSVTVEQAGNASGSYDNFVTAITNSLCGSFTYGGSSNYPWDYGYPSFYLARDVMGNDIALSNSGCWYNTWYTCGTGLGPQYAVCQLPWTYYYKWINNCNTVLKMAGDEPDEDKMAGAGIAYAMRAMFYMDMARMFAQETYGINDQAITVPLITHETSIDEMLNNPRATNAVMWGQIIEDLDKAETYLANYKRESILTPDLSVVYGLKARAYLTMEDWPNAQKYAKLAQSGYTITSEADYLSRTNGFNTPTSAWMFGMTFKDTDANILNNDGDSSWGSHMIIEVVASGCGYASNYGYPMYIDYHLYQTIPSTDFRKKNFVDFEIDNMSKTDAIAALAAYSDVPDGVYTTGKSNSKSKKIGGLEVKFRPKDGNHSDQYKAFTVYVPMMRVEEMYLIEAEAAGMQNEANGIQLLTSFAQTRDPNFVYGEHANETYGSTYATGFQNEVWWQRRVELWGEGFAMFDIKRLNKGVIRSYPNSNHVDNYKWNYGTYGVNKGIYPNWMDWCIVQTESNYNTAIENNPTPLMPTGGDSAEYAW